MDMRSVLDKIAEVLEGDITIEPDWLSEFSLLLHGYPDRTDNTCRL